MVRDDAARRTLFDLDSAIQTIAADRGQADPAIIQLTGVYHNLLRRWADRAAARRVAEAFPVCRALRFSCSRSSMRSARRDSASTSPSPASPMVASRSLL